MQRAMNAPVRCLKTKKILNGMGGGAKTLSFEVAKTF
jgi:hypothetical protein